MGQLQHEIFLPFYVDTKPATRCLDLMNVSAICTFPAILKFLHYRTKKENASHKSNQRSAFLRMPPFIYDTSTNGILMVDKATHILSALTLLSAFDEAGFHQSLVYVRLHLRPCSRCS